MRIEVIQIVAYNNYVGFQHLNFIYWKKMFHYDLMMKLIVR